MTHVAIMHVPVPEGEEADPAGAAAEAEAIRGNTALHGCRRCSGFRRYRAAGAGTEGWGATWVEIPACSGVGGVARSLQSTQSGKGGA